MIPSVDDVLRTYFPSDQHPYRIFEKVIEHSVDPSMVVLELGCGRDAPLLRALKGKAKRLIGVDIAGFEYDDPEIELIENDICAMNSIKSGSIDLCISKGVMEHISNIDAAYLEISRILKEGGQYIFLTPNLFDYASVLSLLVPNFLHPFIVRHTEGRKEVDVFPAYYRSNTRRSIYKKGKINGLTVRNFTYLGQYPGYFLFNRILFYLASRYELFLKNHPSLHFLRGWILCEFRKD